ncbi:ExsB family transcriptional regulator [Amycolatopsis sp. RTGN1]|uniref:ExsB family transcriptional regulator n=1 Tax=Amycolatopsis ponsaeliensis TaxID=2992142 RepID=UPI00254D9229|nr:ExsB family transcriptional regulator [Amycolatopsis sp. RTGN1]
MTALRTADLGHARVDLDRERRQGLPEVVYAPGKQPDQISAIVTTLLAHNTGPVLVSRVEAEVAEQVLADVPDGRYEAGARLLVWRSAPMTAELDQPGYTANGRDRCYFCKSTVLGTIAALARSHGIEVVATGTNADDAADPFRPGIRAGDEIGVVTPLRDEGLSKADVRAISVLWRLSTADKPAMPCLASRVRYGVPVTITTLARIERAEAAVRSVLSRRGMICRDLRVRDLGGHARVELDAPLAEWLCHDGEILRLVRSQGFAGATVTTFRAGALNHGPGQHPERKTRCCAIRCCTHRCSARWPRPGTGRRSSLPTRTTRTRPTSIPAPTSCT